MAASIEGGPAAAGAAIGGGPASAGAAAAGAASLGGRLAAAGAATLGGRLAAAGAESPDRKPAIVVVGCGDGAELIPLAEQADVDVYACDPNAQYCRQARERCAGLGGVHIEQATLQEIASDADGGRFERAYLLFPVPVVLAKERAGMARALRRILALGGTLLLATEVVPYLRQPSEEDSRHLCAFLNTLENEGFAVERNDVVAYDGLPACARASSYAQLFHENGAQVFTLVEAKKAE